MSYSGGSPPPPQPPYDAGDQSAGGGPPRPWMPPNAGNTPNAERYLLEADALRRRQLRSALLHGSSRTWREQGRIWPSVVAGIVVVAVILASFAVVKAFRRAQEQQEEQDRRLDGLGRSAIVAVGDRLLT